MTAQPSEHTTHRNATVTLAAAGLLAVVALMATLVWVVKGQVRQAEVLRAQWQGSASASKPMSTNIERRSPAQLPRNGGGLMAASFDRP